MAFAIVFLVFALTVISTSKAGPAGRIINGNTIDENDFPWHASIEAIDSNETKECGGTIISSEWILTAGQCVKGFDSFKIILGRNESNYSQLTLYSNVSVLHPDYSGPLSNDLALIKLPIPLEFSDQIKPVKLPNKSHQLITFVGCKSRIAGWETPSLANDGPLYFAELSVIEKSKCIQYLGSQITDKNICAEALKKGNITPGDYGAALVIFEDAAWMQIGVASFTQPASGTMSAYMRLPLYLDWINQETQGTQ
ncbi:unnamed protein product [Hermetia illucens]|uniref:Peptidase S1 domain-containing protein n=1 Tax=Hermetia illucens TaxID=343691 RepID=A0A7R8UUX5_HERIL|nr:vitamin K-dependent protein C-like [Hermetia illucens]CAD7087585.1 unnamed protein product [Hermetia illucens]